MGNRAFVVFTKTEIAKDKTKCEDISSAVYLHWNGGPESIYAFLDEMKRRQIRQEPDYYCARFIHVVADYFDSDKAGGLSLGVSNGPSEITCEALKPFDPGDNGVYVVELGERFHVRRFDAEVFDGPVKEWSRARVKEEERHARQHTYQTGIRDGEKLDGYATIPEVFKSLRPKVEGVTSDEPDIFPTRVHAGDVYSICGIVDCPISDPRVGSDWLIDHGREAEANRIKKLLRF